MLLNEHIDPCRRAPPGWCGLLLRNFKVDVMLRVSIIGSDRWSSWKHNIVRNVRVRQDYNLSSRIKDSHMAGTYSPQMCLVTAWRMTPVFTQTTWKKLR